MSLLTEEEQSLQYRALLSGVINAAIDDYQHAERSGVINPGGSLNLWKLGPRKNRNYFKVDGMCQESEFIDLVYFFTSDSLDFLCHLTGNQPCQIRKKLGIKKS
jgi:hypothetical protein